MWHLFFCAIIGLLSQNCVPVTAAQSMKLYIDTDRHPTDGPACIAPSLKRSNVFRFNPSHGRYYRLDIIDRSGYILKVNTPARVTGAYEPYENYPSRAEYTIRKSLFKLYFSIGTDARDRVDEDRARLDFTLTSPAGKTGSYSLRFVNKRPARQRPLPTPSPTPTVQNIVSVSGTAVPQQEAISESEVSGYNTSEKNWTAETLGNRQGDTQSTSPDRDDHQEDSVNTVFIKILFIVLSVFLGSWIYMLQLRISALQNRVSQVEQSDTNAADLVREVDTVRQELSEMREVDATDLKTLRKHIDTELKRRFSDTAAELNREDIEQVLREIKRFNQRVKALETQDEDPVSAVALAERVNVLFQQMKDLNTRMQELQG